MPLELRRDVDFIRLTGLMYARATDYNRSVTRETRAARTLARDRTVENRERLRLAEEQREIDSAELETATTRVTSIMRRLG